jgi:hypothetical protein
MTETANSALEALAATVPLASAVESPDWGDCSQTWAAYVPAEVRAVWAELSRDAKLMAIILGEELVSRERWE